MLFPIYHFSSASFTYTERNHTHVQTQVGNLYRKLVTARVRRAIDELRNEDRFQYGYRKPIRTTVEGMNEICGFCRKTFSHNFRYLNGGKN